MIILKLPESLQRFSSAQILELDIQHLHELPHALAEKNKKLHDIIFDAENRMAEFLNLYLDQTLILDIQAPYELQDHHEIEIVTSFSGG